MDIALMVWTPSSSGYKSPWAVPLLSGFFLFLLAILLSNRTDQALGRQIQSTENAGAAAKVEQASQPLALTSPPVPAFSIELLKTADLPPLSPEANLLVQRGRSFYGERLRIYRRAVWLLVLACCDTE